MPKSGWWLGTQTSEEERLRISQLRREGYTSAEIGRAIGRSERAVWRALQQLREEHAE